jgi:hypothetical protein
MIKKLILMMGCGALVLLPALVSADYVTIPACAFREQIDGTDFRYVYAYLYVEGGTYRLFYAPLPRIPNNSVINHVTMFVYDNDATYNIQLRLYKSGMVGGSNLLMTEINSSGADPSIRWFTSSSYGINYATIRYDQNHHHWLRLYFGTATAGTNLRFYGVKIIYTPPSS